MNEQLIINDLRHWRHIRYDDSFIEMGCTTYNVDNYSRPIIKEANAPCEMITRAGMWYNEEMMQDDLEGLGFRQTGEITWER